MITEENLVQENSAEGLLSPKLPHFFYGGDYNPEQWPEETWQEDVELMQQSGINLVSLGIFSWSKLEPRPDQYDFSWLDRIIGLLHQHGIKLDLATATASPPPWLARLYPETLPVTRTGVKLWPGSRQQYCPSSPVYRARAVKLVRAIANRYKDHPALVMWHINNEYGCHVSECYCDVSAEAFRGWLQQRYNSLEALNEAWGTAFWSQHYGEWAEIYPPRATPTFINPTQQLDFNRFSSDEILTCFELEKAALREITPEIPVTTNFMGFFKPLDYWKWASKQDIISNDTYPDPSDSISTFEAAMVNDLMRSLGGGKPWLLMEQTTSQVNWRAHNSLKRPGQMRLWSYQAIGRGANGIMFFQWRASKAGAEKFHGALVPHIDIEHSRIWREVAQLGGELVRLDPLLDSRVNAQIAILVDWENWWSLELDAHPSSHLKQLDQLKSYYGPLFRRNIPVDFISPDGDFSRYKAILVPNWYMVRDEPAARLEQFVAGGGTVVMSFFSGIVDQNDHIRLNGYPAPFRKMLGLRVEEFDPYPPEQVQQIQLKGGGTYQCSLWSDIIELEGALPMAYFKDDFYAGKPAVTRYGFGQGLSYYLGTQPEAAFMTHLLEQVCKEADIQAELAAPEGVELVKRVRGNEVFLFVLNHNKTPVELNVDPYDYNLLGNTPVEQTLHLAGFGVAILTGAKVK